MKTGIYIGRFQPFHEGHKQCVEDILKEAGHVIILLRDGTPNEKNPFTVEERIKMIREKFPEESKVSIVPISDKDYDLSVYRGREVGWDVRDIKLSAEIEAISATKIRKQMGL